MANSADTTTEWESFWVEEAIDTVLPISDLMIGVECPTRILIRTYNLGRGARGGAVG